MTRMMCANRPNPEDGVTAIPQDPCFGLELDRDFIQRDRLNQAALRSRKSAKSV